MRKMRSQMESCSNGSIDLESACECAFASAIVHKFYHEAEVIAEDNMCSIPCALVWPFYVYNVYLVTVLSFSALCF